MTSPIRCRALAAALMLLFVTGIPRISVAASPREKSALQKSGTELARAKLEILRAAALYTRWPDDVQHSGHDRNAVTLGIVGNGASAKELEKLAGDKQTADQRVVIRLFPSATDAKPCEILFVTSSMEQGERLALIKKFEGAPVLFAGETSGFCQEGGSLNVYTQDGSVRFTLNHQALAARKLTVDPRFARLARIPAQAEKQVAPQANSRLGNPQPQGKLPNSAGEAPSPRTNVPHNAGSPPSRPHEVRRPMVQPHSGGNRP